MKTSYWIVVVLISLVTAFAIGYVSGQQTSAKTNKVIDLVHDSITAKPSVSPLNSANAKSNTATNLSLDSTDNSPRKLDDIIAEIDSLLLILEENPNQKSSVIKLLAILETLSVDELIALAPLLESKSASQLATLSHIIIPLLIENAPDQALAFAQRYNPMPDSPYYLPAIKAQIAEKSPELGFEYLNQLLGLAIEDIDLSINSGLIKALAKADLTQLVETLAKFQDIGVKLDNSMHGLSYGLKTNEEHLSLFNGLRQLNDMSILNSVLISWVKISPTAVFERLNEIEDSAERKKLIDSAFHYWMYDKPEVAADHHLANASNKLEALKEIMRIWPDKKASDALIWISAQSDIDNNRFKIDYLKDLSRTYPNFVQSHLSEINLNSNETIDFYKSLYDGFKRKSSADAEQFLSTLPFKDEVLGIAPENKAPAGGYIESINKGFRRYFDFKHEKAFALAIGEDGAYAYSYYVNQPSLSKASRLAMGGCEARRHKRNITNKCKIYAEGDVTLFNLTP